MTPRTARTDARLESWRTFLRAHARVIRELERELAAEQGLRMSELADALLLSRSGATRLVDRLVADGLVERVVCESDRRGQWAALTERGLERLRRAAPTHVRGIEEHFLDRLSPEDLTSLRRMLEPIVSA